MQILLNLAGFGPLLTSVAISANGMVGRRGKAWGARLGQAGSVGRRGGARLGWLGVFDWQAGLGRARMARRVWLAGKAGAARLGPDGMVGRRGEVWLGRDGTVGWQAIVPLGLSGRDSFRGEEYYEYISTG